jgi:Phosphodiester glycosidase
MGPPVDGRLVLGLLAGGDAADPDGCRGRAHSEIFKGVIYGCEELAVDEEGRGLVHWVRIDLTVPGIALYVTPLDKAAVAEGRQYRLRWIRDVMDREHLAIAINATMFDSHSDSRPRWWPRLAGDTARTADMVIADGVVVQGTWDAYLLSFDNQMTPQLSQSKPPTTAQIARTTWGPGSGAAWLRDGKVWPGANRKPDARTAVAVDERQRLLFLAVGAWISPRRLFCFLAQLGAKDGILLDGGSSSAMAIGEGAKAAPSGRVLGGWRPVATYLAIKAAPEGGRD